MSKSALFCLVLDYVSGWVFVLTCLSHWCYTLFLGGCKLAPRVNAWRKKQFESLSSGVRRPVDVVYPVCGGKGIFLWN